MPVHTMNSSSPIWGSLPEVVHTAKIKGAKASRRAQAKGKARRKEREARQKPTGRCDLLRLCGAERVEPGLPTHLVWEPAAWIVLALGSNGFEVINGLEVYRTMAIYYIHIDHSL